MTITFESDNDIIVYALEKIIAYPRRTQQIFVAQCVWWLASIIGLDKGLIVHMDNLQERSNLLSRGLVDNLPKDSDKQDDNQPDRDERDITQSRDVSVIPRDRQKDFRSNTTLVKIHPDRVSQVCFVPSDDSEFELGSPKFDRQFQVVKETKQFLNQSKKERKKFNKQKLKDQLSRTRSGKVFARPAKALNNKQWKYLQSIPKDTIAEYVANRK